MFLRALATVNIRDFRKGGARASRGAGRKKWILELPAHWTGLGSCVPAASGTCAEAVADPGTAPLPPDSGFLWAHKREALLGGLGDKEKTLLGVLACRLHLFRKQGGICPSPPPPPHTAGSFYSELFHPAIWAVSYEKRGSFSTPLSSSLQWLSVSLVLQKLSWAEKNGRFLKWILKPGTNNAPSPESAFPGCAFVFLLRQ